jgi:hypothetical protein
LLDRKRFAKQGFKILHHPMWGESSSSIGRRMHGAISKRRTVYKSDLATGKQKNHEFRLVEKVCSFRRKSKGFDGHD